MRINRKRFGNYIFESLKGYEFFPPDVSLHSLSSLVETWCRVVYDPHPMVVMVDLHYVWIFEAASKGSVIILSVGHFLRVRSTCPPQAASEAKNPLKLT